MNGALITVSQLNRYIKSVLDGDCNLKSIFVGGEISNFKINSFSGHIYFTLKDENASVKAVMFKTYASKLRFVPTEGMKVICRGDVNLYEKDGVYQLYIHDIQPDGVGDIAVAFQQLKEKLGKEGLFDQKRKKPLPKFPKKIAVITSKTGAAVHDILNILSRRWPLASVVLCPVSVQGENSAQQMCEAVINVNAYTDCDIIIIGRGGGSAEDLSCFNDEMLARCISVSDIPVISAVGHETDFTICDFVADLRAPTPSAAAELATPDIKELSDYNLNIILTTRVLIKKQIALYENKLNSLKQRKALTDKLFYVNNLSQRLDDLTNKLESALTLNTNKFAEKLAILTSKLDVLNPTKILIRGFSVVQKNDKIINSVKNISNNDNICVTVSDGKLNCTVNSVERK